jgi:hypothetical protein
MLSRRAGHTHLVPRVAMSSRFEVWLALEPAHLPRYSHTAVLVGGVIMLAIMVLVAVAAIAVMWVRRGR